MPRAPRPVDPEEPTAGTPRDAARPPSPRSTQAPRPRGLDDFGVEVTPRLEGREHRLVAADPLQDLETRVAVFEDLVESEVGDTSLGRARNVEREVGLRQIYLKFEGGNPTGTQKDRIAFAQVQDALRRGYEVITAASCGNYGVALALASSFVALRCLVFVPKGYRSPRTAEIERLGGEIVRTDGDYEAAVEASRERAEDGELYDANPGGANSILQMHAYGGIAYEIYDELRDAPAAVAVPVSNGTTLAGIRHGFVSLYRRGKTSRIPRMIAGSSLRKNPIVESWRRGHTECIDLDPATVRETTVNEPLINWHSSDGDPALASVRETSGWASYTSDRALRQSARMLRESEGLHVLPASTAGLIALLEGHAREPLSNDRYVAVITAKR